MMKKFQHFRIAVLRKGVDSNGNPLRGTRKAMTQSELGGLVGKGKTTIWGWENNTVKIGEDDLGKLASLFGVKVDFFYSEVP